LSSGAVTEVSVGSGAMGIAPVYRDDERIRSLIEPGGAFEVENIVLDGVPLRSFVRAPATIVDAFQMGRNHETLTHLVFEGQRLTFGEVRAQALSLARELKVTFGVSPGDRVALAMRNFPEFVIGFWAAAVLGAIVVPLNAWWSGSELVYALDDAGAVVCLADEERLERLTADGTRSPDRVLVGVKTAQPGIHGSVPFEDLAVGPPLEDAQFAKLGPEDPVTLLYTSGTTGHPKGALGTNRNAIANFMNMGFVAAREALISGRPLPPAVQIGSLASAPLFHIGGIASIVGAPMSGAKIVLMRRWSLADGLALAHSERVTSLGGIPTIARQLFESAELPGLRLDVRTVPLGGASVPPDLPRRALEIFGDSIQLLNGYGLTETTSAVVANLGVEYAAHLDSVGRPNLTADIRVEDSAGRALGIGQVGELCFRSPQVVRGYWNNPVATSESFVDGWFHSGDLGYVDAEGFVYVVDRLKDVVIRGGENVYCAEVEAVLFDHPGIADVAVVGVADETMGERVCAVVVARDDLALRLGDLRRFALARLAAFKCPEALCVVAELPKTATGKVSKKDLRQALAGPGAQIERS
jgi:long-chain acyl-CoA synthetase